MALTATASQGYEFVRTIAQDEVLWLPGDPGVTYTRGDLVALGATGGAYGLLIKETDSLVDFVATVEKTVVCPSASTAFPIPQASALWGDESAAAKTLIPVRPLLPVGAPVLKCTFANHKDDTVISYATGAGSGSGSGAYAALTTGMVADDRPNGAWVYVYTGTGAGQVNIVDDYDHTGGTVELMLAFTRPFEIALDSTSKIIVLSGEASANCGIGALGRIDAKDENELDAADGSNDGDFVTPIDFRSAPSYLRNLTLPVCNARHLFNS